MKVAGPPVRVATTGTPAAMASRYTDPNASPHRGRDEEVRAGEAERQFVMAAPAEEEDAVARTGELADASSHSPG